MTYESLLKTAMDAVPGFSSRYYQEVQNDSLDDYSGMHTVFSFVFVPLLFEALNDRSDSLKTFFDFMEKMEKSEDVHVQEVCEYTVLEELCDSYTDADLVPLMGEETKRSFSSVRGYIVGPQQNKR